MNQQMTTKTTACPDDYHDYIYRLAYFLLAKVVVYIPRSIKPNQITVLSFISAMTGAALLLFVESRAAYLYWVLFNFIWFVLDSLDGIHARLTNQTSEFGGFLDHALDNIYFIFMLTAFAAKFDLLYTFYVYILLLRVTAAVMVFTVQAHTGRMYLSRLSGGFELLLFTTVMFLSYFFPHFNLAHYTTNSSLLHWISVLHLQRGAFMKITLFIYAIAVPINFVLQFRFVSKELRNRSELCA